MKDADVCLILEGTYPYVSGGVSSWTHHLILAHPHLNFALVCLHAPNEDWVQVFELPPNVVSKNDVVLQEIPEGKGDLTPQEKKELFQEITRHFMHLIHHPTLADLSSIAFAFSKYKGRLNGDVLLDSTEAWEMVHDMYHMMMEESSYLNFFWTWRCLVGGFFSILLAEIPKAEIYHSLCTGYAGLLLARAKVETGKAALLTEHGIYTNERRIEVTASSWLSDQRAMDMSIEGFSYVRDLKDFWIDSFKAYSRLTYEASDVIITLFDGNRQLQILDGADEKKISIVRNGIDYEFFASLPRDPHHPPTVALIGRVVPIKDIKTFLYAASRLLEIIPTAKFWILGGVDEDPDYFEECVQLAERLHLKNSLEFLGKVSVPDYLPKIDVVVLTSISEGQPLSILEAGAAGIPCVTTDVGSCAEILFGAPEEVPNLGQGGIICPLSSPLAIAEGCYTLLSDPVFYKTCSENLQNRVRTYYTKEQQVKSYNEIYDSLRGAWRG